MKINAKKSNTTDSEKKSQGQKKYLTALSCASGLSVAIASCMAVAGIAFLIASAQNQPLTPSNTTSVDKPSSQTDVSLAEPMAALFTFTINTLALLGAALRQGQQNQENLKKRLLLPYEPSWEKQFERCQEKQGAALSIDPPPQNEESFSEKTDLEPIKDKPTPETFSQLMEPSIQEIDERLFQHILGDYFGMNSGFEGYSSERMITYIRQFIDQRKESPNVDVCTLQALTSLSEHLKESEYLTASFKNDPPEQFKQNLEKALASKKRGESCSFMIGWNGKSSGHAIFLQIFIEENEHYSVKIFNRGAGINYHAQSTLSDREQSVSFEEINEIKKEDLFNDSLLKALGEMKSPPRSGHWEALDLYEGILPFFKGKKKNLSYPAEKAMENLQVGHCTFLSITAFLHENLPTLYPRLFFELQFKTLSDFFEQNQEFLRHDPAKQWLILQGAQQLARNQVQLFEKKWLTEEEMHFISKRIDHILNILEQRKNESEAIPFYTVNSGIILSSDFKEFHPMSCESKLSLPNSLETPGIFIPSIPDFPDDCTKWHKYFAKLHKSNNLIEAKQEIHNWVRKLPISWLSQPGIWEKSLSPEEAEVVFQQLAEIGFDLLNTAMNIELLNTLDSFVEGFKEYEQHSYSQDPLNLFSIIKLLALTDAIAKDFKKSTGADLPGLYQFDFDLLFEQSGSVLFFDPDLEDQVRLLKAYWEKTDPSKKRIQRNHISFFGLEAAPPGAMNIRVHSVLRDSISCPSTFEWPYLVWTADYLQNLAQRQVSREEVLKASMNPSVMPPAYISLAELSWASNAIFQFPAIYSHHYKGGAITLLPKFKPKDKDFETSFQLRWKSNSDCPEYIESPPELRAMRGCDGSPGCIPHRSLNHQWLSNLNGALLLGGAVDSNKAIETYQDYPYSLRPIYGLKRWTFSFGLNTRSDERLRIGPHLRYQLHLQTNSELDDSQMRELLALGAVRDLQVVETLAYFQKNPHLLAKRDYQILFRNLIFQPPLLIEQLLRTPSLANQLASFTKIGYLASEKFSDRQMSEFFLDINRYFAASVDFLQPQTGISSEGAGFLDTRQELLGQIAKLKDLPKEQSPYWFDLLGMIGPASLSELDAIDLLSAVQHLRLYPISETHSSYSRSEAYRMYNALPRFQGALLEKFSESSSRNRILNAVLYNASPKQSSEFSWESFPESNRVFYAVGSNPLITINIATGEITKENGIDSKLPQELLNHRLLKPFIGSGEFAGKMGQSCYVWTDPNKLKIQAETGSSISIRREIEPGVWARYQSESLSSLPRGLLFPDHEILTEESPHPQRFWIANAEGTILYRIEYTEDSTKVLRPEVTRPLPSGEEWVLELPSSECAIGKLEEPGFILVWKDRKNKMMSVELPRYHLTFIDQGKGLQTEKLPGFVLSETGYFSSATSFPSLVLSKKDKMRRIWLNPLYPNSDISKQSGKQFFQANEMDGKLHPVARADSFFLCLLKLKNDDYHKALSFLDSEKSQLSAYTPLEIEILQHIAFNSSERKNDLSPSGISIQLRASYMLLRNGLDFKGTHAFEKGEIEHIQKMLWLYRQHQSEMPLQLKLTTHEESWLRKKITQISTLGNPDAELIDLEERNLFRYLHDIREEEKSFSSSSSEKNDSLLRKKGLAFEFKKLFSIVNQEPKKESYQIVYTELFGKTPSDTLSLEKMSKDIESALSLIAMSRTEPEERAAALMLLAAMKNPEKIPIKEKDTRKAEIIYFSLMRLQLSKASIDINSSLALNSSSVEESSCSNRNSLDLVPYSLATPEGLFTRESFASQPVPSQLINLFDIASNDPAIQTHLIDLSRRLKNFSAPSQTIYHLKNKQVLERWKGEIRASIELLQGEDLHIKKELLLKANKAFSDPKDQAKKRAKIQGQSDSAVSMEDLIFFSAYSNSSLLIQKNQALSCEEADEILDKTRAWLLQATHLQHLQRISYALNQLESLTEAEDISIALEEIVRLTETQRNYDPKKHPNYLVFEFYKNILIWPEQVENLEKLQQNGIALEMIMGGGKTAVLTPLLAFEHADGESLVVQMMPEALIPSMSEALKSSLWSAFSKTVELIEVNRNTPLAPLNLQRLHSRLENAIAERKIVILSASSLNSLFLRYAEIVKKNPGADVEEFQKIFRLLRSKGILVMDEMDLLVDVLQSHQFSYGKREPLHQDRILAVSHLYKLILTEASLKEKIRWNFVSELKGIHPLTKENYDKFQPLLIEKLLSPELAPSQEARAFFASLSSKEKSLLTAYLKKEKTPEAESFVSQIASAHIKNLLADWKEEIGGQTLFMTASAVLDENYGENPITLEAMAIPFHGSEAPAVKSQFGTDLEILNYSIQTHLKFIRLSILQKEIDRLKELIKNEFDTGKIREIEESVYHKDFLRLSGGKEYPFFALTETQLQEILANVNANPEIKFELSVRYLLPTIRVFRESSEVNIRSAIKLFKKRIKGFSGTFWNANSYPKDFDKKELSTTEVKTLTLLWEQNTPTSVLPNQPNLKETINALFLTHRGSIADRSGLFRGIDSELIASEIADLPIWKKTPIKGVAFYDALGQKKIFLLETKQVRDFDEANLSKNEIIAYWSQRYTTGSDIPLGPNMQTIVTIGQRTTMRDLLQAVWRNRQLHRSQRVAFVVPYEDSLVIKDTLKSIGRPTEEQLSLKDILLYTKYLEATKQGNHNLRALPYDLQNVLFASFLDELLDEKDLSSLLPIFDQHFFKKTPKEPYEENGAAEELIPGSEFPKHAILRLENSVDFKRLSPEKQENIRDNWKDISEEAIPGLPGLVSLRSKLGTEMQLEQETEQEREQEMQQEREQEKSIQVELPSSYTPQPIYLWKMDGLFTQDYFTAQLPGDQKKVIPPEFAVVPDYEKTERFDHPLDRLDVEGPNPLASHGIRLTQRLEAGTDLLISLNAKVEHKNSNLLIIQDRKTDKISLMLLNQWDALMFQRMLEKDKKTPLYGDRDVRLALYRPELGIIGESSDPIELKEIKNTASFHRLIAQAKFFNDETSYTPKELEQLKQWFHEQGSSNMERLFKETLKEKSESKRIYTEIT